MKDERGAADSERLRGTGAASLFQSDGRPGAWHEADMAASDIQALYREAQRIARVGHWSYDPNSARFLWCSEMAFELLGLDPERSATPSYETFLRNVPAEDRVEIDRKLAHSLVTGESFSVSHRVVADTGEIRFLEVRGVAYQTPEGSVGRMGGTIMDITERHLAQERSRMFESLAEATSDAILISGREGQTIRYANPAAWSLFGAEADGIGLIGLCERAFWPDEDVGVLDAVLERRVDRWVGDVRQRRLDGATFEANVTLFWMPAEPGPLLVAVVRDISERKRIESELKRIQFAVDHASLGVFLVDPDSRLRYVNKAVEGSLGYSREELLTMTVKDIDPVVPRAVMREIFQTLRQNGHYQLETLHQRKDGTCIPVEISSNYFQIDGEEFDCCFALDITERKRAEQALLASRHYLSDLIDTVPDALFAIDAEGVVTIWNRAIEQMSGVAREDVVGRGDRAYAAAFYGDGQPMLIDLALAGRDGPTLHNNVYDYLEWDGDVVLTQAYLPRIYGGRGAYAWGKATALRGADGSLQGALEIIRDITHEKEAEAALRSSEARFRSLVSNAPVLIFEFDAQGLFTLIEGRGLDRLGATPASLIGTRVSDFFGGAEGAAEHIERAIGGDAVQFTARLDHGVFETFLNPVNDAMTGAIAVIGVAVDVTERTERESELQQRTDELTRFTYTVSHDLKSPLVTILTFLGFLVQDIEANDRERIDKDVGFMRNAAERMSRLLEELLELSRIGRILNEPTEFSLQEVVQEALDLVAGRLAQRGVEVTVTDRAVMIRGDRRRLAEVFLNLLDNAVKFLGDQAEPRISVDAQFQDDELVISVSDNGIGVDPRHAHKIFGLFEKLSTGTEGTGIGLTLVQRIIELHGGRIWMESGGLGLGARFAFTLPETRLEEA